MSEYVTDPELLKQLNSPEVEEYVSDADVLKQLNAPETLYEPGGPVSPYMVPPTSLPNMPNVRQGLQTARTIVGPTASSAGELLKKYTNIPKLMTDVTLGSTVGVPPVAAKTMAPGVEQSYRNLQDWLSKTGQFAPQTPAASPTAPAGAAAAVPDELAQAAKINQALGPEGLANYMKSGQMPVAGGPAAQEGATFIQRMAKQFAPVAARVAPVINTVGRVAGPVGLGLNAMEVNRFATETDLGGRIARGEVRDTMRQGQQRMMNAPTPAPLTRQEAANLLASGDERTINIYGGRDRLMAIAGQ